LLRGLETIAENHSSVEHFGETLQEASIFQQKFKDGNPAKERILNRYRCESNGQSIATGTPKQQNPIGKPCN
jgi:hypothetical protein